ncbi:Xrn1 helical domain-containing protein [Entamoeba marina]
MCQLLEHLISLNPTLSVPAKQHTFNNVYIDVTPTMTTSGLDKILSICQPDNLLYLANEGATPLALLRSRKHKCVIPTFSLLQYATMYQQTHPTVQIIVSDQYVSGTVSDKLSNHIRCQLNSTSNSPTNLSSTRFLELTHCFVTDNPTFVFTLHLFSAIYLPKKEVFIDIASSMDVLFNSVPRTLAETDTDRMLDDIIFLSLIASNQVLPSLKCTFANLLNSYSYLHNIGNLTDSGMICISKICNLLHDVVKNDNTNTIKPMKGNVKQKIDQINLMNHKASSKIREELQKLLQTDDENNLENNIDEYWKGLMWIARDAFQNVVDWEWKYPSLKVPPINDLINKLKTKQDFKKKEFPYVKKAMDILVAKPHQNIGSSLEWITTEESEFYTYFKNPNDIDSVVVEKLINIINKLEDVENVWGWPVLVSRKVYDIGKLNVDRETIPSQKHCDKTVNICQVEDGVEGTIVQVMKHISLDDKTKRNEGSSVHYYGLINPWFSTNCPFVGRFREKPKTIIEGCIHEERKRNLTTTDFQEKRGL